MAKTGSSIEVDVGNLPEAIMVIEDGLDSGIITRAEIDALIEEAADRNIKINGIPFPVCHPKTNA